ncbi:MAG: hypothetical protein BMS9Abin26_1136 [Gammaproteobacteria bacterium]|nr:MAG: hypothetical protein BMS9Abin26_1136 [Gammaproteobacteria bacterium]
MGYADIFIDVVACLRIVPLLEMDTGIRRYDKADISMTSHILVYSIVFVFICFFCVHLRTDFEFPFLAECFSGTTHRCTTRLHVEDLNVKGNGMPGQRVIKIHHDVLVLDLDNRAWHGIPRRRGKFDD